MGDEESDDLEWNSQIEYMREKLIKTIIIVIFKEF